MKHLTGEPTQFKFSTSPDAVVVDKLDTTHNSAFREKFLNRLKFERAGQATKILSDF